MSHRTSAEVVADSVTSYGDETRLTTIYCVFPKMVLAERNRHRGFSLSDRSSRAVPTEKLIIEVYDDPAMPAKFRRRAKGMGGGEELVGGELAEAERQWRDAARMVAARCEWLARLDLAKEIVNRPLDPFIRMHSLMTATRDVWLNFFGLRLDVGADPTIQVLARKCLDAYRASEPKLLQPSQWHLPMADDQETIDECRAKAAVEYHGWASPGSACARTEATEIGLRQKLSAARCAHLSYYDLATGRRMTIERALAIYDKLVRSQPMHLSPLEHAATPDFYLSPPSPDVQWQYRKEHGNLFGWRQFRKMLPGEAVAPLPEGYSL